MSTGAHRTGHGPARTVTGARPAAGPDPAGLLASMVELGAGLIRAQQRLLAGFLRVPVPVVGPVTGPEPADEGTGDSAAAPAVTTTDIALRAEEISRSPEAGSDVDNWLRAERELRAAS